MHFDTQPLESLKRRSERSLLSSSKLIINARRCMSKKKQKSRSKKVRRSCLLNTDIVRTFPNNPYFEKNNSGYYSMFKVLCAYSNLNNLIEDQYQTALDKLSSSPESSGTSSTGNSSSPPTKDRRRSFKRNRNNIRNNIIDSFLEISFNESTNYVQGMNFIVGILVYHLSPELAFCIFVKLMKEYKLEENYVPGLPGFKEKSEELNKHLKRHLPLLNSYFVRLYSNILGVQVDIHRNVHS